MKPYYDDGTCVIYHGDCREILPWFGVDLVLTDPPYGLSIAAGAGAWFGRKDAPEGRTLAVRGDETITDVTHLLTYPNVVLWGANHFAPQLPLGGWLVWDKREHTPGNQLSDVELAWRSRRGPARIFRHYWNGPVRASERGFHVHPTQKPVALMRWCIEMFASAGALVLDPYMGSGPVLAAARQSGRRAIGIEIEERYCEIAAKRLAQDVLPLGETA